jgi:hypothetical protein
LPLPKKIRHDKQPVCRLLPDRFLRGEVRYDSDLPLIGSCNFVVTSWLFASHFVQGIAFELPQEFTG